MIRGCKKNYSSAMQTKRQSIVESATNTGSGFLLSYGLGFVVFPLFGHSFAAHEIGWITLIYTVASVVRNYVLRRMFNKQAKR
jgi:O-antigen/teichoic acid export membrane protein